jgi:hypothetical protein
MARASGYRVGRLRERRKRRLQTWEVVVLVVLAVAVAFGAVLGAARLADWIMGPPKQAHKTGYLGLIVVGQGEAGRQPSIYLALRDATTKKVTLFTVPRSLLLTAPGGEYVFAADMVGTDLKSDLERLLRVKIDFAWRLPYAALDRLAGRDEVWADLEDTATLTVNGAQRGYKGRVDIPAGSVATLLSAKGKTGADESAMQDALTRGVLDAAALQPDQTRRQSIAAVVAAAGGGEKQYLSEVLGALTNGDPVVERIPSEGQTAMGQFAWRPVPEQIMAQITRRVPGYQAPYTVVIRNGSGEAGIGQAVADRIASLDVNLPPVANASSFDYQRTQILAGAKALDVAQEVRAILGRGVVLDGSRLGPTTIMVIIGKDLSAKDLQE